MIKSLLYLFLVLVAFFQDNQPIYWSETQKLGWQNFRGVPDAASPYFALTSAGAEQEVRGLNDTVFLNIRAAFTPEKSWVKKNSPTPALLAHEQLHFDITELRTRMLRKALKEARFTRQDVQQRIGEMMRDAAKEDYNMQSQYDTETDHSKNAVRQKEWETKVTAQLKALSAYSTSSLKLTLAKQ